jgi:C1A family cysteine protease
MPYTANDLRNRMEALKQRARQISKQELSQQFIQEGEQTYLRHGIRNEFEAGEAGVPLILPSIFNADEEPAPAVKPENDASSTIKAAIRPYQGYYKEDHIKTEEPDPVAAHEEEAETQERAAMDAGLPSIVDHRPTQSKVKAQGGRETCVAHASLGLLEAFSNIPDDLSEQFAHYQFNTLRNRPHDQNRGIAVRAAAELLANADGYVCAENTWPYIRNQKQINKLVRDGSYKPPAPALQGPRYGVGRYQVIAKSGPTGDSIQNPRFLEALLHRGHDIVVGVWMAWNDRDRDGILEPVVKQDKSLVKYGGHAMLIVGYNRPKQYFIVKNSWGPQWGHNGYAYLHYDFIRLYAADGFVVTEPKLR